jgi:hypothetical protein
MRATDRLVALLGVSLLAAGCDMAASLPTAGVPTIEDAQPSRSETAVQAMRDCGHEARAGLVRDLQRERATSDAALLALRDSALSGELEDARGSQLAWIQLQAELRDLSQSMARAGAWLIERIAR